MKKVLKVAVATILSAILFLPTTVSASENKITLSPLKVNAGSEFESKEFNLKTYDDNGITVYGLTAEEPEYCQVAMDYIKQLTGDIEQHNIPCGPLLPGQSEYHNDTQYVGKAMSYAWKRNTAVDTYNEFEGGQATSWTGKGKCSYIVLNQGINIGGIGVTISWPPSISGNGNSGSWQSQPIYNNIAGSSFSGLRVSGLAYSCSFSEGGDVYVGSRVYRPMTYINFSLFS